MKKVLIAQDIHSLLKRDGTFIDRTDLQVFSASTSDAMLQMHRAERVDLIITMQGLPGMPASEFCRAIRDSAVLRDVSIILTCAETPAAIRESTACSANAVLLEPVHPLLLAAKAEQLLSIAARRSLRVLLTADVVGDTGDGPFSCRTSDVSSSGLLIETDRRLDADARLTCQFALPDGRRIKAAVKIIRAVETAGREHSFRYGLMYTDLSEEDRRLLDDYVWEATGGK